MKIRLHALQTMTYAGRRLQPGAEFDARGESDACLLLALGRARRASDVPAASSIPQRAPRRADVVIAPKMAAFDVAPQVAALFPQTAPGTAQQGAAEDAQKIDEPADAGGDAPAGDQAQPQAGDAPAPRQKRAYTRRNSAAKDAEKGDAE